jgi:hypothetical protein
MPTETKSPLHFLHFSAGRKESDPQQYSIYNVQDSLKAFLIYMKAGEKTRER